MERLLKYPWFPFYGNDFLVATIGLSCEQVGAYVRLLCIQWDNGSLPADIDKLATMAGCHGNATAVPVHLFGICQDGLRRNERLEELRQEKIEYSQKQAKNAEKRWVGNAMAKPRLNTGTTTAKPTHEPNACLSQSQSHLERDSVVPPMSRQEYDQEFSTRPWTPDFLNHYWNELDACDWQPKNYDRPLARKGVGSWLANRWPDWQANDHERKHGKRQTNPPSGDRNAGTYNEGRTASTGLTTADYAEISQRKNREMVAKQELERLQRSGVDPNASGGNGVPEIH